MARSARSRPLRTLFVLVGLIAVLYGLIAAGVWSGNAQATPKLALDLEGGTEIVLSPQPIQGQRSVDPAAVDESVNIIRQRVNGSGISEAEVTRQGSGSDTRIVVSLPGKPDQATIDLVERSAQLQFRPVLVAQQTLPPQPLPTGTPTGTPSGTARPSPSAGTPAGTGSSGSVPAVKPAPSRSTSGMDIPQALLAASTPTGGAASPGAASVSGTTSPRAPVATAATPTGAAPGATPSARPTDAFDPNWVTPALQEQFAKVDCGKPETFRALRSQAPADAQPFITCASDGTEKYVLGPTRLKGTDVTGATAGLETNSQGVTGTAWQVNLTFSSDGAKKFGDVTSRLFALQSDPTRNRFAIVLDNLVISAPRTEAAITTGSAQISGNFTQQSATDLANQLKYGALPVSFRVETSNQISATLGNEQLRRGLLAGLIGLALVVVYSLLQYRALGLVTIASLVIAAVVTYGLVVLLGWRQGYRLSLPGVAGLIVSIGITADSFIVFFERVRDEVREGRGLQAAVEAAWKRARRTILTADAVSLLAAVVLYVLAIGSVRGFAFTLGLTTLVDVLVVFLFTKPMVTLLARTRFFGGGHRLSGFDAAHLGRAVSYAGRGRVRPRPLQPAAAGARPTPEVARRPVHAGATAVTATDAARMTIAERRAQRERAAADGDGTAADAQDPRLTGLPETTPSRKDS